MHEWNLSGESATAPKLRIIPDGTGVHGLEELIVKNSSDIYSLLDRGSAKRKTAATLLNKGSSRSHSVFCVTVRLTFLPERRDLWQQTPGGLPEVATAIRDCFPSNCRLDPTLLEGKRCSASPNSRVVNIVRIAPWQVHIPETNAEGQEVIKTGKLWLVDLAGSENISRHVLLSPAQSIAMPDLLTDVRRRVLHCCT